MWIRKWTSSNAKEYDSLLSALHIEQEGAPVISIVGAGGKTSVLWQLAHEYKAMGQKAIVTTTTHIYKPKDCDYVEDCSFSELLGLLEKDKIVCAGALAREGKLKAVSEVMFERLLACEVPVLIEADGAKGMPCKVPKEHEPVIVSNSKLVIGVVGVDCLERPIYEVCHRAKEVASLLNEPEYHLLTIQDLKTIILSDHGLKKGIHPGMRFVLFINKVDSMVHLQKAKQLAAYLNEDTVTEVIFTSFIR